MALKLIKKITKELNAVLQVRGCWEIHKYWVPALELGIKGTNCG